MTSLRRTPAVSGSVLLARPLLAVILAVTLVGGPISPAYAQDTPQKPPPAPAPQSKTNATATPISLGTAKHNFTRAPRPLPNLFAPYRAIKVEPSAVTNSPRIEQLIHEGKLELSLQDAVELALENSVDIAVQRYYPWIADVGFGDSFTEPLRLDERGDQLREGRPYRLDQADGRVTLLQEGSRQYVFTLTPRRMPQVQGMCHQLL